MHHDEYHPQAPILAVCPHCTAAVPGTPNYSPAMLRSLCTWQCPNCGGEWDEMRALTGSKRFWEARPRVLLPR